MPRPRIIICLILLLRLSVLSCQKRPEDARRELAELNIPFTRKAFMERIRNSDVVAVELFLLTGMNPNGKNQEADSPLYHAVKTGNIDIVNMLIEKGASLTTLDLSNNQISDLSPLSSLNTLEMISLGSNPLSVDALTTQIPALKARGVNVREVDLW